MKYLFPILFFLLSIEIYAESDSVDCTIPQEGDAASVCDQHLKGLSCKFEKYRFEFLNYEEDFGWRGGFGWLPKRGKEWICFVDQNEDCRTEDVYLEETPDLLTIRTSEYQGTKKEDYKASRVEVGRVAQITIDRYDLSAELNFQLRYVGAPEYLQYRSYGAKTICNLTSVPKKRRKKKI